jgi:hypothetical protein
MAITAPTATISTVPTIAEAMPPPVPPNCGGSWVRNVHDIALTPSRTTSTVTPTSATTAIAVAARAP